MAVNKNPFKEEKVETREWHERLGDSFWKTLYRAVVTLEELDAQLSVSEKSPCPGFQSQVYTLPQALAIIAVLDYDDMLFLPRELSLAAIYRGVSVEQFVGQWRGNLLDPGKGRLPPGMLGIEAFRMVPSVGHGSEKVWHALGIAMAMRRNAHPKVCVLPLLVKDLQDHNTLAVLRLVGETKAPLVTIVVDGSGRELAEACGVRAVDCISEDFFTQLKLLKGQMDRTRAKAEPIMISFSSGNQGIHVLKDLVRAELENKSWLPEGDLLSEVRAELKYGIEKALMIPSPPRNTVIQDVRFKIDANLEEQWREWRQIHGK